MADWSSQWLVCAIGGCYGSVVAGVHECLQVEDGGGRCE